MKLCIFPGTFNPIHNAHLKMAQYALDNFDFDKVLFIPAYKPPHKSYDLTMCAHRFNMVKIATSYNPAFEVSKIEFERNTKSYTYLTILDLYKKYNIDGKINMIIGSDAFAQIESWYECNKLKKLVDFIVFVRDNKPVSFDYLEGYNYKLASMDFIDISSTDLRKNLAVNKTKINFIPQKVEEYIREHGLYKDK